MTRSGCSTYYCTAVLFRSLLLPGNCLPINGKLPIFVQQNALHAYVRMVHPFQLTERPEFKLMHLFDKLSNPIVYHKIAMVCDVPFPSLDFVWFDRVPGRGAG